MLILTPPKPWLRLPPVEMPPGNLAAFTWMNPEEGLRVLRSVSYMPRGVAWLHVSVSRVDRIPGFLELKMAKEIFIGENLEAAQVFPKQKDYVNFHPFCLHLWSALDMEPHFPNLQDIQWEQAV